MIYLLLAAIASLLVAIVFKLYGKYKIETFQAVVFNYLTCTLIGLTLTNGPVWNNIQFNAPWLPLLMGMGALFVGGFYIAGMTIYHFGVAVASVAQRMSLVISVTFAIFFFNEPNSLTKMLGILLAVFAVICINIPHQKDDAGIAKASVPSKWHYLYPFAIFIISGIIEVVLQYVQKVHKLSSDFQSLVLFGLAGLIGTVVLITFLLTGKSKLTSKSILGGILLGVPNYFSIYFLLLALEQIDGSVVYPVNNIMIVIGAALTGYFVFKEHLNRINILGVILAILSILLITI